MIKDVLCQVIKQFKLVKVNWWLYVLIILLANIFTSFFFYLVSAFSSLVLKISNVPYVSNTTITGIVANPLCLIGLLISVFLLVWLLTLQLAFITIGIDKIQNNCFSVKLVFVETVSSIKNIGIKCFPLMFLFFIVIFPFIGLILHTVIFDKFAFAGFLIDYIAKRKLLLAVILIVYIFALLVLINRMYVLPLIFVKKLTYKQAILENKNLVKKTWLKNFLCIFISMLIFAIFALLLLCVSHLLQTVIDNWSYGIKILFTVVLLTLSQLLVFVSIGFCQVFICSIIMPNNILNTKASAKKKKKNYLILTGIFIIVFFGIISCMIILLPFTKPIIVSHRAVDDCNGVQNTIPAFLDTIEKVHPDYVEIDVQETKDNNFIVMHDDNLKNLCGIDAVCKDYTLEELKSMQAYEFGNTSNLASFDEFLELANLYNQKLLIEVKPEPKDSENMLDNFLNKYKDILAEHKHTVQSFDYYKVMKKISEKAPEITTVHLLSFNINYPNENTQYFNIELTTLNFSFHFMSNFNNQNVFAWTVLNENDIFRCLMLRMDGIVTDYPGLTNEIYEDFINNPKFSGMYNVFINYDKNVI